MKNFLCVTGLLLGVFVLAVEAVVVGNLVYDAAKLHYENKEREKELNKMFKEAEKKRKVYKSASK